MARTTKPTDKTFAGQPAIADIIERNIGTMLEVRQRERASRSRQDRFAHALTRFSGSMWFAYIHAGWFGWWIAVNRGWIPGGVFDPFPFGLLTLLVSLEAIFLSTFVLISQNRAAELADMRADLDLQIDLLAEHEITRVLKIVAAIGRKLEVEGCEGHELEQLRRPVAVGEVVRVMDERARETGERKGA